MERSRSCSCPHQLQNLPYLAISLARLGFNVIEFFYNIFNWAKFRDVSRMDVATRRDIEIVLFDLRFLNDLTELLFFFPFQKRRRDSLDAVVVNKILRVAFFSLSTGCLLYTSDAADE